MERLASLDERVAQVLADASLTDLRPLLAEAIADVSGKHSAATWAASQDAAPSVHWIHGFESLGV